MLKGQFEAAEIVDNNERIAAALLEQGLITLDDFLPPALVAQLATEAIDLRRGEGLRPAGIGRGPSQHLNEGIRGDQIRWLEPDTATPAQRHYLEILEALRQAINRHLFLGLYEFEGHLALYPPGAYYRKHLDQFQGTQHRLVTVILYLNPDWRDEDGGQLRIYPDPTDEGCHQDLLPVAGRLVCFLSGDFPHEVLPARRERLSITGWFRQRD